MNKSTLALALGLALSTASIGANAALVNGSTLNIGTGSTFEMEVAPTVFLATTVVNNNGVVLGTAQAASGSHTGAPNGTENPGIDKPWLFFGNTGLDYTSSPTNVLTAAGNTADVDFSGWTVTWNSIASIPMSGGAWGTNASGVANVTCGVDCGNGDTYSLYYTATVPAGSPSGFGGVKYRLNLKGTVSEIPVPAAIWLLGSGLLGLVGVARRKMAA